MENSLKEQITSFLLEDKILDTSCFYFYDWFCKKSSLEKKAKSLMPKVIKFVKIKGIDLNNTEVFFKNNCPMVGKLYDDFRISDKDGNLLYTVVPSCGHKRTQGEAELWGIDNQFEKPIIKAKNWKELLNSLNS